MTNEDFMALYCPACQGVHPLRTRRHCYKWQWEVIYGHAVEQRTAYCKYKGRFVDVFEYGGLVHKVSLHGHND